MFDREDLQYLEHMEQRINERTDVKIDELEKRLTARMDAQSDDLEKRLTARMDAKNDELEKRLTARMDAQKDEILKESMHNMRVIVESDIMPKMNLILDAVQTLSETMVPKARVDALENELQTLKQAHRMLAQDVAELKKAQ